MPLKNLVVLNDYIIIKPAQQPDEEISSGGIVVPKNPGDPNLIFHYATVEGIGPGVERPRPFNVGDIIYYAQKSASALAVVEDDYLYDPRKANYAYIKMEDVIAVVRATEES
jgi:co-chaperonin GroES (HSP10)